MDALLCRLLQGKEKLFDELKDSIIVTSEKNKRADIEVRYSDEIEALIDLIVPAISEKAYAKGIDPRWLAIKMIEEDEMALDIAGDEVDHILENADENISIVIEDDPDILIADGRYGFINSVCHDCC